jgi:hypothetical protein
MNRCVRASCLTDPRVVSAACRRSLACAQVSLIRKSETKRRKAAALRREEERVLRAEQALRRSAEREAERRQRIAGAESLALIPPWHSCLSFDFVPFRSHLLQRTKPAKLRKRWRGLKLSRERRPRRPRPLLSGATWRKRRQRRRRRCQSCRRSCLRGRRSRSATCRF